MTDNQPTSPDAPALEILFRYLMLYYDSPDGLRILIPRKLHRASLRDIATDAVIPLSEAFVRIETDGTAQPSSPTTVDPNGLLLALERPLQVALVEPLPLFLSTPVDPSLNALIELAGGHLKAYPSEAFPEKADDDAVFEFGPINIFRAKVTDTTLFRAAIPTTGRTELVIASPRRTYRIDISYGGRFEVRNLDEKFGSAPTEREYHRDEFEEILRLIDHPVKIQCDIVNCAAYMCGSSRR